MSAGHDVIVRQSSPRNLHHVEEPPSCSPSTPHGPTLHSSESSHLDNRLGSPLHSSGHHPQLDGQSHTQARDPQPHDQPYSQTHKPQSQSQARDTQPYPQVHKPQSQSQARDTQPHDRPDPQAHRPQSQSQARDTQPHDQPYPQTHTTQGHDLPSTRAQETQPHGQQLHNVQPHGHYSHHSGEQAARDTEPCIGTPDAGRPAQPYARLSEHDDPHPDTPEIDNRQASASEECPPTAKAPAISRHAKFPCLRLPDGEDQGRAPETQTSPATAASTPYPSLVPSGLNSPLDVGRDQDDNTNPTTICSTRQPSTAKLPIAEKSPLPQLPYNVRDHKTAVLIIWTLLLLDTAVIPLILFYGLWFGSDLDPSYVCVATTSVFGVVSGIEWFFRSWKLITAESLRPLGVVVVAQGKVADNLWSRLQAPWRWIRRFYWGFDAFHWSYTFAYGVSLVELIVGSSFDEPVIRLCATPSASFVLVAGIIILIPRLHSALPSRFQPRILCPISSQPACDSMPSKPLKPATYTILEDVIAVDTGTGRRWRQAVLDRYDASWRFRKLLRDLDLFWGIPAILIGVISLIIIAMPTIDQLAAYGIGWALPPLWALLWALITWRWVRRVLALERREWSENPTPV